MNSKKRVEYHPEVRREIRKLPDAVLSEVCDIIDQLTEDPLSVGSKLMKRTSIYHYTRFHGGRWTAANGKQRFGPLYRLVYVPTAADAIFILTVGRRTDTTYREYDHW